jgi:hypothetical protein
MSTQRIKIKIVGKSRSGRDRLRAIIVVQGLSVQQTDVIRREKEMGLSKNGIVVVTLPSDVIVKVYPIK